MNQYKIKKYLKDKKNQRKIIIISILIILLIILFSTVFAVLNINNNKIYRKINIQGRSFSGYTKEEAIEELNKVYREKQQKGIKLKYKDYELIINFDEIGVDFKIEDAVEKAYLVGRKGNILQNNYSIIGRIFFKKNIEVSVQMDDQSLDNILIDLEKKLPDTKVEPEYYIEENNLIILKGKAGPVVKKEELKNKIKDKIYNLEDTDEEIEIPVEIISPEDIDIYKIYEEVAKEPEDAFIVEEPFEVHPEQNGIEFSIDDALKILEEDKAEYSIPLTITKANKTVNDLGENIFPDLLATFVTNYDASNKNRSNNLELASKKLDGKIVNSGDTFSYNQTVGERTIEAGYKEAKAYAGGKVVQDVGGGICQLSSTLYNSVLLTNFEVVERSNHHFKTSYVPEGRDATVSWGTIDFKFKNNRKYPIKIVSKVRDGVVKVSIYGIKEDDDYMVTIESNVTEVIPQKIEKITDSKLNKGQQVVTQEGEDGCRSETYKILSRNGVVFSKTLISKDTYNALNKIIHIGN